MNGNFAPRSGERPFLANFEPKMRFKMLTYRCMLRFFNPFFAQTCLKNERSIVFNNGVK